MMELFQSFLGSSRPFLSEDPSILAIQAGLLFAGIVVVFFIFLTTRDILLRTRSFWLQLFCILLVTFLPIVGFFLYLLVRPPLTLFEQDLLTSLEELKGRERKKK